MIAVIIQGSHAALHYISGTVFLFRLRFTFLAPYSIPAASNKLSPPSTGQGGLSGSCGCAHGSGGGGVVCAQIVPGKQHINKKNIPDISQRLQFLFMYISVFHPSIFHL
jgi:hypothetical protein